ITTVALFRIEPGNRLYNGLFHSFFSSGPGGTFDPKGLADATVCAVAAITIAFGAFAAERRLGFREPVRLRRIQRFGLPLGILITVILCFDFSLASDALHYMTNIGPALHMLHGGTLMVDTFSQYGPGPVLVTYLAFRLGGASFQAANIAIQCCNILFYVLLLLVLWRGARFKLTALWVCFVVCVVFFFALAFFR